MLSYVARINYAYKGKYMLTVSSRWDGSSKFQKDNRWGMFPSAAMAWRISDENFMGFASKWLRNLKLRASFGLMTHKLWQILNITIITDRLLPTVMVIP